MRFLKKKSPDDWLALQDKELDEMIEQLHGLPKIDSLTQWIRELELALKALKKKDMKQSKREQLAQSIHFRAKHIHDILEDLAKKFGKLSDEAEDVKVVQKRWKQADEHLRNEYYSVDIRYLKPGDFGSGDFMTLKFRLSETATIGAENCHLFPPGVSAKQLTIKPLKPKGYLNYKLSIIGVRLIDIDNSRIFRDGIYPFANNWIGLRLDDSNFIRSSFGLRIRKD